jgi:anti-repressor protein
MGIMENQLQLFTNEELGMNIRVKEVNGKVYAVANDVLRELGYAESGWRTTVSRKCDKDGVTKCNVIDSMGRVQEINIINEGNIYRLIAGSKLESAVKFEKWVFDEVLPSIRKDGGYIVANEEDDDETILAKALIVAQKTIERKNAQLKEKEKELEIANNMINTFTSSKGAYDIGTFAKILNVKGLGRNNVFAWLKDNGYLMKNKEPYQIYLKYFKVIQVPTLVGDKIKTLLTPNGVIYFYKKLSKEFELNKTKEEVIKELTNK